MTAPGTFDRVYSAIKRRLLDGMYRPGTRLEPAILANQLYASVTPVRDALHRLTGEKLVEAPRHEGFRTPMMTETMLRQLYGWHFDLVMLAVMKHRTGDYPEQFATSADEMRDHGLDVQNALFVALVKETGNPEHVRALRTLTERLEPVQRIEALFLDGTEGEIDQIVLALKARDRRALRKSLVQYHRRRERIVPQILEQLLQRQPESEAQG